MKVEAGLLLGCKEREGVGKDVSLSPKQWRRK